MVPLALALSLVGVLKILVVVALLALLLWGVRWLLGKAGVGIPEPLWTIVCVIVVLLVLIAILTGGVTLG